MGQAMHEARRRAPHAAWLAGCSLAQGPRQEFHPLRDGGGSGQAAAASARIDKVLLVSAQAPPGVYGSDRMVFSKDGHSRSYFQFGFWSERPAQTLLTLAEARLARSQRFSAVAASTVGRAGAGAPGHQRRVGRLAAAHAAGAPAAAAIGRGDATRCQRRGRRRHAGAGRPARRTRALGGGRGGGLSALRATARRRRKLTGC